QRERLGLSRRRGAATDGHDAGEDNPGNTRREDCRSTHTKWRRSVISGLSSACEAGVVTCQSIGPRWLLRLHRWRADKAGLDVAPICGKRFRLKSLTDSGRLFNRSE